MELKEVIKTSTELEQAIIDRINEFLEEKNPDIEDRYTIIQAALSSTMLTTVRNTGSPVVETLQETCDAMMFAAKATEELNTKNITILN